MTRTELEIKLTTAREELVKLKKAYERALSADSWETRDGDSSRKVQNQSLAVLSKEISKKESEITTLENMIANNGKSGRAFRVGVIW